MKKLIYVFIAIALTFGLIFTGCASQQTQDAEQGYAQSEMLAEAPETAPDMDNSAYDMDDEEARDGIAGEAMPEEDTGSATGLDQQSILEPSVDRKIVYTGNIEARTKNFDEDYDMILSKLVEAGGYVQNSYINGTKPEDWQDPGRYAQITLRIPSKNFDSFITMLKGIGENLSTSISGDDISLQYYDTETRLKTLRIREERLQELLDKAAELEDIIELERELADVSYQIQMYETDLRNYDSLVDFSTINISLYEVNEISGVTQGEDDLGTRISNGFFSVLNALADFGEGFLIFIIAGSPVLVPLAIIIILIIVLVKRSKKKRQSNVIPQQPQGDPNQGGEGQC